MRRILPLSLLIAVSAFGQAKWATLPLDSVIVEFRDAPVAALSKGAPHTTLARFRADLASVSRTAEVRREYSRVFNGVSVRVPRGDLAAIARLPYVKRIHDDHQMHSLGGPAVAQIGASTVWTDFGTRGKGVVVAVIDTGVDYTHEALGKGFGPGFKVVGGYDFVNDDADPMDDHGHGTHVSGIIAGDSATLTGVAPEATLMAFKVLNSNGSGSESDVIAAIERAADPNGDGDTSDHVDVVNLSVGGPGGPDDAASRAVDNGSRLGIVFCIAAGNSGKNHTVLSPGAARQAITVGAVDGNDIVADFSSRGPNPSDMTMKPEVSAPGVQITSSVPNNGYLAASGTSMATPHVSGAAALLKALHRDWTPAQIKAALMLGAVSMNQDAMAVGAGRINVAAAAGGTLSADNASIDFGLDPIQQASWSASRTVHLTSRADKSVDWTVSTTTPFGVATTLTPQTLTLAPGATADLNLAVNVDNAKAFPAFSTGGVITLTSPASTLHIPWTYVKAVRATLKWDKEQADVLWLDSTRSLYADAVPLDSNVSEVLIIKPEDYDVIVFGSTVDPKTSELTRGTFLYFERQHLDGDMTINATEAQGTHVIRGATTAPDGKPLRISADQTFALSGRLRWPAGTAHIYELLIPPLPLNELYMNDVAEGFTLFMNEAYVDFLGNTMYAIQHPKMNGVKGDVTLAASNVKSVPVQLLIPSSPRDDRRIAVRVLENVTAEHAVTDSVWNGRVFVTPDVDPAHTGGGIAFTVITDGETRYVTPRLSVVDGQVTAPRMGPLVPRHDTGMFLFGAGPQFPLLNFCCVNTSLRPGVWAQYFGSRGETLVTDPTTTTIVTFDAGGKQIARSNHNQAGLNLSTPGRYTVEITDHLPQYPDLVQQLKVTLSLDSSRADYLPPTLTGIYLLDNGGNSTRNAAPHSAATLYFSAADYADAFNSRYQPIQSDATALWYRYAGATAWNKLALTQVTEDQIAGIQYRTDLSSVTNVDWARVDLKFDIQDSAGNTTSVVMRPAFSVGSEYPARRRAAP
jgi:subtilisin family serine protease